MFPLLSKRMDVVCFFAQDPDEDDASARDDVPAHNQLLSQVTWIVRWDDYAHFEAGWAANSTDPASKTVEPAHPFPTKYIKIEQRFMRAVGMVPRRLNFSATKTYEVRNYTFGDGWTAENAAQYKQWAADEVIPAGGRLATIADGRHQPATGFFAADPDHPPLLMSRTGLTDDSPEMNVPFPDVCWVREWDQRDMTPEPPSDMGALAMNP